VEITTMAQADDWGLASLKEVFIEELFIFRAAEYSNNIQEYGKCEYIKYSASVGNNDMQDYNKKGLTTWFTCRN
jgi:hypothetical protein